MSSKTQTTNAATGGSEPTSTVVGNWRLRASEVNAPNAVKVLQYKGPAGGESVIEPDQRKLVEPKDFAAGGKYRSVVKLFCQYSRQEQGEDAPWAMGTGWLIKNDLIVTAGHNAYDWRYGFGRVARVKAYIGYYGKEGVSDPSVQYRTVSRVATTVGWLSSRDNKNNDLSFMQVDPPFTGVLPYKHTNTPMSGSEIIGIVGYPGDKIGGASGEHGARMYEEFKQIEFDRSKSHANMLDYTISTFGGNSGSPVFRQDGLVGIGIHTYGGEINSATCIGELGNHFAPYLQAFSAQSAKTIQRPETIADTTQSIEYLEFSNQKDEESFLSDTSQESFLSILGSALSAGGSIVSVAGPLGMLAGTAMAAAGSLISKSSTESGGLDVAGLMQGGVKERAILNDAALHAVYQMDPQRRKELGIDDTINQMAPEIYRKYKGLSPLIEKVLIGPAYEIALSAAKDAGKPAGREESTMMPERRQIAKGPSPDSKAADPSVKPEFIKAMAGPKLDYSYGAPEGFFKNLGPLIQKGLVIAQPILKSTAVGALDGIIKQLGETKDGLTSGPVSGAVQRAAVGEAAFEALLKVDPDTLKEEGIFDGIVSFVQKVGPPVLEHAPGIISGVTSLVSGLIGKKKQDNNTTLRGQHEDGPWFAGGPPRRI